MRPKSDIPTLATMLEGRLYLLLFGEVRIQTNDRPVFGKGNEQCVCFDAALIGCGTDAAPGGVNFCAGGFDLGA